MNYYLKVNKESYKFKNKDGITKASVMFLFLIIDRNVQSYNIRDIVKDFFLDKGHIYHTKSKYVN